MLSFCAITVEWPLTIPAGFFPNMAAKPSRKVFEYNVAEQAAQVIASDI